MKKLKTLLATALLSTATSTLVYANSPEQKFEQGIAAYTQGDYHTAFELWKPLAEQGDAKAQYNLAKMYDQGKGVKQDYQQAAKWSQKAAEQGYAEAQFILGTMYYQGEGVKRNHKQAKIWFGKACDNRNQSACDFLKKLRG